MLTRSFLLLLGIMLYLSSFSQNSTRLDTIYLLGQKKMVVQVKGVSPASVRYVEPDSDEVKTLSKKKIQRVIYDTGRKEVFNKPLVESIMETDWRNVVLTENKDDVDGLYPVGKVTGKSSASNNTVKSAERTARIRMQKRAANRGGVMVLITNEETTGGFGEVPTFYMEGIVYSFEKPEEQ